MWADVCARAARIGSAGKESSRAPGSTGGPRQFVADPQVPLAEVVVVQDRPHRTPLRPGSSGTRPDGGLESEPLAEEDLGVDDHRLPVPLVGCLLLRRNRNRCFWKPCRASNRTRRGSTSTNPRSDVPLWPAMRSPEWTGDRLADNCRQTRLRMLLPHVVAPEMERSATYLSARARTNSDFRLERWCSSIRVRRREGPGGSS
jgi:hypothetical protein